VVAPHAAASAPHAAAPVGEAGPGAGMEQHQREQLSRVEGLMGADQHWCVVVQGLCWCVVVQGLCGLRLEAGQS